MPERDIRQRAAVARPLLVIAATEPSGTFPEFDLAPDQIDCPGETGARVTLIFSEKIVERLFHGTPFPQHLLDRFVHGFPSGFGGALGAIVHVG
jgi:hypothetical protein